MWSPVGTPQRHNSVRLPGEHWKTSPLLWGGEPDSCTHKRVNPGGGSGLHLGTRVTSSSGAASSGSKVAGLLGVGPLLSGSTLGVGNGAFPLEAGATVSFLATSNILRSTWSPLSITWGGIYRALVLLCRASPGAFWKEQCTSGGPWTVPLFLCATLLDNLEFP